MISRKLIGIFCISTSVFGAEYYVTSDSNIDLGYESSFTKKGLFELNAGGIFGKNKEIFVFGGAGVKGDSTIDGKGYAGVNFRRNITEELELILNASYTYKTEKHEKYVKEFLKKRVDWEERYEKDKEALKGYYHSQGLRFKENEETLFSLILNYNHKLFKLHSGSIYTAGYLQNGEYRVENFVNIKTKKGNHEIEAYVNHKLKKDTYEKGGRLRLELNTLSKLGKLEISNKGKIYLGTIVPNDKKNYSLLLENGIKYNANNLELLGGIGAEVVFKEVKVKQIPKSLYKPEIKFDVKYSKNKIEIESKNKLKARVDLTDKFEVDANEYKKDSDQIISLLYTNNRLKYDLTKELSLMLVGKYGGYAKMTQDGANAQAMASAQSGQSNKVKFGEIEHLLEVGAGVIYNRKTKSVEVKHNSDVRYIFGHVDKKNFSIINAWSDNKAEYSVNERLTLSGELNFTSSNRLSILNHSNDTDELLLLADTKGTIDYKTNKKLSLTTTLGANTISLFSQLNSNVAAAAAAAASAAPSNDNKLHLTLQYSYKLYNENKLRYEMNDNVGIIGKLNVSYSTGIKSDKLYESLNRIKRNQIGEKGIEDFSKEETDKIKKDENSFGANNNTVLLISPGLELDLRYLGEKLQIRPSIGVDVSAKMESDKQLKYKATNVKADLKVEYRW
ncbi:hypothetical protein [Streptobacillus notomytis]|uniref:hypothetical protein n=1 Tax=Streptobacillus notomytis TaxID=1712031 RepID=UPI000937B70F|nr:hypothetical protein [Streptobacillus notomytis]